MPRPSAATQPLTWILALLLLVAIDFALVRTPLVWRKQTLLTRRGFGSLVFWQTYDVARRLYRPLPEADVEIALLGNSRFRFASPEAPLVEALERRDPGRSFRVDNLSFYGARIGDLEMIARHLHRIEPSLVVIGLGGSEIVATNWGELANRTGRWFDVGFEEGPLPADWSQRTARWLRTVWPLFRLRLFVRWGLQELLWPDPEHRMYPTRFRTVGDVIRLTEPEGAEDPEVVERAYAAWRREPNLAGFLDLQRLRLGRPARVEELPPPSSLTPDLPGLRVLDRLLERRGREPGRTLIVLLPENPVLDEDREGRYHTPGFSDRALELIRDVADEHGVPVVDARRWIPAEGFLDFDHPMPEVSGFQEPFAEEILRVLRP